MARPLVLLSLVLLSGCFGSFALTERVAQFNRGASDEPWVRELLFVALLVVPVYEVALLGDALVLNIAEAANGENPLSVSTLPDGRRVVAERAPDGSIELRVDGQRARRLLRKGRRLELVEDGVVVGSVEADADGGAVVTHGDRSWALTAEEVAAIALSPSLGPG